MGITLWSKQENGNIIGSTTLGEKSIPSDQVSQTVVDNILKEIQSYSTIDKYAFDQILPFMAIAGNSSCVVREISNHAATNIWLIKQFFDVNFEVKQNESNILVKITK